MGQDLGSVRFFLAIELKTGRSELVSLIEVRIK